MSELDTDKIIKPKCKMCRDRGLKCGCPKCGKVLEKIIITDMQKTDGVIENETVTSHIPSHYRGLVWDKNELIQSHPELDGKMDFNRFVSQLDKAHQGFMNGVMPKTSAIIIAPRRFSKQTWANSCIQFGIKTGHKMFPVMSSNLVRVAMANMFDQYREKSIIENFGYTIEDLMTADCLFISIDSGTQVGSSYKLIDELMTMRANFDRPTIFLSRHTLKELTRNDRYNTFASAIDKSSGNVNRLRYPSIMQCSGERSV